MKILEANAGPLTNFEVLDFLRSRGASKDPTRVLTRVAQSEYKVYDYLVTTPANSQTREKIKEFVVNCRDKGLAKAELLNIINLRPGKDVEIYPIIRTGYDKRFDEEKVSLLIQLIEDILPPVSVDTDQGRPVDADHGRPSSDNEEITKQE